MIAFPLCTCSSVEGHQRTNESWLYEGAGTRMLPILSQTLQNVPKKSNATAAPPSQTDTAYAPSESNNCDLHERSGETRLMSRALVGLTAACSEASATVPPSGSRAGETGDGKSDAAATQLSVCLSLVFVGLEFTGFLCFFSVILQYSRYEAGAGRIAVGPAHFSACRGGTAQTNC